MVNIVKNEAIVLKKTKFRESSLIVQLYSKEHGRISAIVKGARSPKSKIGSKIDLINHVEVVFYKKEEKDLHLLTQVNLINPFNRTKNELEKLKYASAVCELILKLIPENEASDIIFRGSLKILNLINKTDQDEIVLFTQYLLFFVKEIGYEINFNNCSNCGKIIEDNSKNAFSYSSGIICDNCNQDKMISFQFSEELFNLFKCLTSKIEIKSYNRKYFQTIITLLEKYLIYHNSEFNGIKSIQIL
ncbi:MAG: DNA repair protein RecO [Melioribacteraceae bacterium]|nr:DNA repair protein RecO [Melioribacteraceae bacterium]